MDEQNESEPNRADPDRIVDLVQQLAQSYRGDSHKLLHLLRLLEGMHQDIRETLFQEALPSNRQALYGLLRDIEREGGWPYIPVMKLHLLLQDLESELNLQPGLDLSQSE